MEGSSVTTTTQFISHYEWKSNLNICREPEQVIFSSKCATVILASSMYRKNKLKYYLDWNILSYRACFTVNYQGVLYFYKVYKVCETYLEFSTTMETMLISKIGNKNEKLKWKWNKNKQKVKYNLLLKKSSHSQSIQAFLWQISKYTL